MVARPVRIEFAGAVYHVTSRGDRHEAIYEDDEDRYAYLKILAAVVERFGWCCYAYCLMGNLGANSRGWRAMTGGYREPPRTYNIDIKVSFSVFAPLGSKSQLLYIIPCGKIR